MATHRFSPDAVLQRVLGYLRSEHSLAWAVVSPDLIVLEASEYFRQFQSNPALEPVGSPISELFWELVGGETELMDVIQGQESIFSLQSINREAANGSFLYLSIKAIPLFEEEPGMVKKNAIMSRFPLWDTKLKCPTRKSLSQKKNPQ